MFPILKSHRFVTSCIGPTCHYPNRESVFSVGQLQPLRHLRACLALDLANPSKPQPNSIFLYSKQSEQLAKPVVSLPLPSTQSGHFQPRQCQESYNIRHLPLEKLLSLRLG